MIHKVSSKIILDVMSQLYTATVVPNGVAPIICFPSTGLQQSQFYLPAMCGVQANEPLPYQDETETLFTLSHQGTSRVLKLVT